MPRVTASMTNERRNERVRLKLAGREYVVVSREDYDRLVGLARTAEMPHLPSRDADGNFPAAEYARASIARTIVQERVRAGLTQRELARLAGVRVETLCRIEKGRNTASMPTVAKIEQALQRAGAAVRNATKRTAG